MTERTLLGAHTSAAGGVENAPPLARRLGYRAVQLFTRNRAAWDSPPLTDSQAERFRRAARDARLSALVSHNSYLVNFCSPRPEVRRRSFGAMRDELDRCARLGVPAVVMHPGSPGDPARREDGLARVAEALDRLFDQAGPENHTRVLLETTAGQGACLGGRFDDLADIIARVDRPDRIGVCLDTCHLFAAGYDLRARGAYEATMRDLDRAVGVDRVGAVHLNDSARPLGSRADRHAHIGAGYLGLAAFGFFLNDSRLARVPMVLETPKSPDGHEDVENLARLRALIAPSP